MIGILATASLAFAIVLSAMLLLTGVCLLLRRLSVPAREKAVAPTIDAVGEGAIDPRTMVVIAAAVAEVLGRRAVIHRVHVHRGGALDRWSRAGRLDIMVSHRVGPTR